MSSRDYDVVVIGGGSGGYAAARNTTAAGLRTAVIEGGEEVGGLCILRGCMPTKTLLYAAEVMHLVRHGPTWGVQPGKVDFNFREVMERKNTLIGEFADYRVGQLTDGRFAFIRARARFVDPHTLTLDNGQTVTADHFVVATGSVVAEPPIPSLRGVTYLTSDDALRLTELPQSMVVLGGGAVAVELAQFFLRFGVKVTLVQRSPHILREEDTDTASAVEAALRREGMTLYTGTRLIEAWQEGDEKGVTFEHAGKTVRVGAESMLFALGRTPNTSGLDLERAGVKTDGARIVTDERMQTSAAHIYAAGDCTGPHEIVHIAIQQGEVAAHNIAHPERRRALDYRLLVRVVFTDPQVGVVGLTEKQARAEGRPVLVASHPFNDHGKSIIMDVKEGFAKLLADPVTGDLLGGCCVGPVGGELIHEIIAAMAKRMTAAELAAMPHYHPTLAEIWTYPAEELADQVGVMLARGRGQT